MNRAAQSVLEILGMYGGYVPVGPFYAEMLDFGYTVEETDDAIKELYGRVEVCTRSNIQCVARVR